MRTLLVVGLVATTAFSQAPESISERIYNESSYVFDRPDSSYAIVSLRADGTYTTIIHKSSSSPVGIFEGGTWTIAPTDEGTFTYVKTSASAGSLTFTSTKGLGVIAKSLVFASENLGVVQDNPYGMGGFSLSSIADAPVVNASTRGTASASKPMIIGFYVSGRPRYVLVRAIGPTLAQFDVPNAAEDTIIEIIPSTLPPPDSGTLRPWNDNWNSDSYHYLSAGASPPAATIGAFMGAFPLPEGSKDAALALQLPPGGYTAIIRTKSEMPAEVLGEIYIVP